jgi:hypothetical protein
VLDLLLMEDFDGVEELRRQALQTTVVGVCDCGCPTIYLCVAQGATPAPIQSRLAPVEARVSPQSDEPPGEVILFLKDGWLDSLEYVFYTDLPPSDWPSASRLGVVGNPRR